MYLRFCIYVLQPNKSYVLAPSGFDAWVECMSIFPDWLVFHLWGPYDSDIRLSYCQGLQERDERIRKLHAQNLEMEKVLREQNDERAIQLHELKEKLERQTERKEEIKLQLEEKEAELEDVKKAYR